MDRVVVILGVGRVDGDKREFAPVLARGGQPDGPRGFRLFERSGGKDMRDMMGLERDEAHRSLGLD